MGELYRDDRSDLDRLLLDSANLSLEDISILTGLTEAQAAKRLSELYKERGVLYELYREQALLEELWVMKDDLAKRIQNSDERNTAGQSPWAKSAELFRGTLAFITPVLWFTYFCSSFAIYLKSAFGVLFMETLGIERTMAADLASINGLLGAIGGVFVG